MNAVVIPEEHALLDKVPFKSTANQHSRKKKSSCSHSYSQLLFCTLLAQHFVQWSRKASSWKAIRFLLSTASFFLISFTIRLQKHTPCHKGVVCVQDRWITSGSWMQAWLTVSVEPQPKHSVAAWKVRSSKKENFHKESICYLVAAQAHSLSMPATKAAHSAFTLSQFPEQWSDRARLQGATGIMAPPKHWARTPVMHSPSELCVEAGPRWCWADYDMGCRCIYYVNQK